MDGGTTNWDGVWIPNLRPGTFIWALPPAAARIVIERQARHKRQLSFHVYVYPRLMWIKWKHHCFKAADLIVDLPCGSNVWPSTMHEPLTFALFLPYLRRCPWELRKSVLMGNLERHLQCLLKMDPTARGIVLSHFLHSFQKLDSMSLQELHKVMMGRAGFAF